MTRPGWGFGQQFGLLIDRVAALAAALRNLTLRGKDPIHRADRTEVDAFVQQGGEDLSGCLIGEAGCAQMGKYLMALDFGQGPR